MICARSARSHTTGTLRTSAASRIVTSACCSDDQILSGWLIAMTTAPMAMPTAVAARRPGRKRLDRAGAISDEGCWICPWIREAY